MISPENQPVVRVAALLAVEFARIPEEVDVFGHVKVRRLRSGRGAAQSVIQLNAIASLTAAPPPRRSNSSRRYSTVRSGYFARGRS